MNYEEKYKQALERAKYLKENTDSVGALDVSTCFEEIFPELRESEDENIRKGLIKGLSAMRDIHKHQTFSDDAISIDDAIAWLEKQKCNKTIKFSEEDERMLSGLIAIVEGWYNTMSEKEKEYYGDCGYINWLKSLKPQNRWKPSEEQMSMLLAVLNDSNNITAESVHIALKSLYQDLLKL